MFGIHEGGLGSLENDRDEAELRRIIDGLVGETHIENVTADLRETAAMALYHGRRMGLESEDAFDALAALCLVLGEKRRGFFENMFVKRMLGNRNLTPVEKLHRMIEMIIGTVRRREQARAERLAAL